jgi:hypothetical protein
LAPLSDNFNITCTASLEGAINSDNVTGYFNLSAEASENQTSTLKYTFSYPEADRNPQKFSEVFQGSLSLIGGVLKLFETTLT